MGGPSWGRARPRRGQGRFLAQRPGQRPSRLVPARTRPGRDRLESRFPLCLSPLNAGGVLGLPFPFRMTCAVLSIGTELTRGELANSNGAWLGAELTALGFEVTEHAVVDDDRERIVEAVQRLAERGGGGGPTGGPGPTADGGAPPGVPTGVGGPPGP